MLDSLVIKHLLHVGVQFSAKKHGFKIVSLSVQGFLWRIKKKVRDSTENLTLGIFRVQLVGLPFVTKHFEQKGVVKQCYCVTDKR